MNSKDFAIDVVTKLQAAGYQAFWAGGCVRDLLMDRTPKDYDVATEATPEQVQQVFGKRRTLSIGASFGVMTVLGPRSADPIEIATFRRDVGYSDGRRPDSVEFTNAREDALRRDFTINGMFYDPIACKVHDFVGGQHDIESRQIRAIGDAHARIEEDKLRMLRGIRFASTFDFSIESETLRAIQLHASQIDAVSGERIGAEMRRMLSHPNRREAAELLRESNLFSHIVPHAPGADAGYLESQGWIARLDALQRLSQPDFSAACLLLLEPWLKLDAESGSRFKGVERLTKRWKLSNEEKSKLTWILRHQPQLMQARQLAWSVLQPLLQNVEKAQLALAVIEAREPDHECLAVCRERLAWPADQLNPVPLVNGQDLLELGIPRGPKYKMILDRCRAMQLDGELDSKEAALRVARQWAQ